jgi:hypothetical protein
MAAVINQNVLTLHVSHVDLKGLKGDSYLQKSTYMSLMF